MNWTADYLELNDTFDKVVWRGYVLSIKLRTCVSTNLVERETRTVNQVTNLPFYKPALQRQALSIKSQNCVLIMDLTETSIINCHESTRQTQA